MKSLPLPVFGLAMLLPLAGVSADVVTNEFLNLNKPVPDNLLTGVSDTHTLSGITGSLLDVQVNLTLEGGPAFNGDYYVSLSHGSTLAILLNRPGRTAGSSFGYSDNGFNILFDDTAAQGDIHEYRLSLFGNPNTPVDPAFTQPLTGIWSPDGRNVPPATSLDTTPRTALLSSFADQDPNGDWTLFLADASSGGTAVLASWSLITVTAPEPATLLLLPFGMGLFALLRWNRPRR